MPSTNTCHACSFGAVTDSARPASGRDVALLAPNDLVWAAVRSLLQSLPNVRVSCDITKPEDLRHAPLHGLPDVAISALRVGNHSTLPLLKELQRRAPAIRILLLVDGYRDGELAGYPALSSVSCLCWNDLKPETLRHCLEAVLAAPLELFSPCLRQAGVVSPSRSGIAEAHDTPRLDGRELAVLAALAAGLTQQQAATATGMSPRTVQRTIAALQSALRVSSLFALGCAAERLGLIAPDPPGLSDGNDGQVPPPA